jgi:uncharacterized integral membrane protein
LASLTIKIAELAIALWPRRVNWNTAVVEEWALGYSGSGLLKVLRTGTLHEIAPRFHKRRRKMVYVKWIILIIVLLFFITFGVKNSAPVYLNYYFDLQYIELPLYGLVYIAILLGIFIGMIVGVFDRLNLRKTVKRLEKEKKELHQNLTAKENELERTKESAKPRQSEQEKEAEKESETKEAPQPVAEGALEEDKEPEIRGDSEEQGAPEEEAQDDEIK